MRAFSNILIFLFVHYTLHAQYYIRGELQNEQGEKLQNVRIVVHSTGLIYHTGVYGDFGITSSKATDTLTFSLDNYESVTTVVDAISIFKIYFKNVAERIKS